MSDWISVKDELPSIGDRVLICEVYEDGYTGRVMEAVRYRECKFNRFGIEITPTHWMPLPEPPKDGE